MKHENSLKKDRFLKTDKTQPTKIIPFQAHGNLNGGVKKSMHAVHTSNSLIPPQPMGYIRVKKHDHL